MEDIELKPLEINLKLFDIELEPFNINLVEFKIDLKPLVINGEGANDKPNR